MNRVILGAFLLVSCSLAAGHPPELERELRRALQRATAGAFWGVALVARDGEILLEHASGNADYDTTPNTIHTLFETASVSKQFTAAAILRLHQDGLLQIDDPVSAHLPDGSPDDRGVTIRQLLSHTSGISGRIGLPYASDATRQELIDLVLGAEPAAAPGETFEYCNACYALLAAIVEEVSGRSFEDYVWTMLLKPAGMESTGFIGDERLAGLPVSSRLSSGAIEGTAVDWDWGWGYRGMGGVVTTAPDLLRWDRALRTDAILDAATRELFFQPDLATYAAGWYVRTSPRGTRVASHAGSVVGYRSVFKRYLDEEAVVIVLTNDAADPIAIAEAMDRALFPPLRIVATLDASPYRLNEWRWVRIERATSWRATTSGDRIELTVIDPDTDHRAVAASLPAERARLLARELRDMLGDRDGVPDDLGNDSPSMEIGLYLQRYDVSPHGQVDLEGLTLMVQPRSSGIDADGARINDERLTLILSDDTRRFSPLITKMNAPAARSLLTDLDRALAE